MSEFKENPQARLRYWHANLKWLAFLLTLWFVASFGCGILFVDKLDNELGRVPGTGFKWGFWFAQQGSIYVFLVIIAIYVVVMNKLDTKLEAEEGGED